MRIAVMALAAAAVIGCGGATPAPAGGGAQAPPPESEPPVALNPDVPIAYPVALFEQRIDGDVVLRLFVDSAGRLIPESTRVAESSNYPALDSAALAGSVRLRFAPAKRRGIPVATAFLQPVEFRHAATQAGAAAPAPAQPTAVTTRIDTAPAIPVAPQRAAPPPRPLLRLPSDTAKRPADSLRVRADSARTDTTKDTTRAARDTSAGSH